MPDKYTCTEDTAKVSVDAVARQIAMGVEFGTGRPAAQNAAAALGVSKELLSKRLRYARRVFNLEPVARAAELLASGAVIRADNPSPNAQPGTNEPKPDPILVRRLRDENERKRGMIKDYEDRIIKLEDLRSEFFNLGPVNVSRLEKPKPRNGTSGRTVVLHVSDIQYGEYVSLKAMDGVNSYSIPIANARIQRYFKMAYRLMTEFWKGKKPDEVVILLNGDMVSGSLHHELATTDEARPMMASKLVAEQLAAGIELISGVAPVRVITTVGNHGRTTLKPESKDHALQSYDALVTWFIEAHFAKHKNVTVLSPGESVDALFSVYDFNMLVTHGDRIGSRGGMGFLGSSATILRGHQKLLMDYSRRGITLSHCFTGHFHTAVTTPWGIANGCVSGYNEYARDARLHMAPPTQGYYVIHDEHGLIELRDINVGHVSEGTSCSPVHRFKVAA